MKITVTLITYMIKIILIKIEIFPNKKKQPTIQMRGEGEGEVDRE